MFPHSTILIKPILWQKDTKMSHFYGSLHGQAKNASTQRGSKNTGMTSYTASWKGAIEVQAYYDAETDQDMCIIKKVPWQGVGENELIYHGPIGKVVETIEPIGIFETKKRSIK